MSHKIQSWVCDGCGRKYDEQADAAHCESLHPDKEEFKILKVKYDPRATDFIATLPQYIVVERPVVGGYCSLPVTYERMSDGGDDTKGDADAD
jgi:hypothetical protein